MAFSAMRRKITHISLRFSKHVAPPPPPPPPTPPPSLEVSSGELAASPAPPSPSDHPRSLDPYDDFGSTTEEDEPPLSAMARQPGRRTRRNVPRRKASDNNVPENQSQEQSLDVCSSQAAPSIKLNVPRKREIPASIGGGKGDVQPPAKRAKKDTARSQAEDAGAENPDSKKRQLRSQTRTGDYDKWFKPRPIINSDTLIKVVSEIPPEAKPVNPKNHEDGKEQDSDLDSEDSDFYWYKTPEEIEEEKKNNKEERERLKHYQAIPIEIIDLEEEARKAGWTEDMYTEDPLPDVWYEKHHKGGFKKDRDNKEFEKHEFLKSVEKIRRDYHNILDTGDDIDAAVKIIDVSPRALARCSTDDIERGVNKLKEYMEWYLDRHQLFQDKEAKDRRDKRSSMTPSSRPLSVQRDSEGDIDETCYDEDEEDGEKVRRRKRVPKPLALSDGSRSSQKRKLDDSELPDSPFYKEVFKRERIVRGRSQRNLSAFGAPLSDSIEETRDFDLPEEYKDDSTSAREARAHKRARNE